MRIIDKVLVNLEIDECYSELELESLGLSPLNNHGMDYYTYEKNAKVYFFEKIDSQFFRLFCKTNRQSFYLS